MRRKAIIWLVTIGILVLGVVVMALPRINFYMLTGHFSPIHKIEVLQNSIAVTKWSSAGLSLADGRTVQLPGMRSLPNESVALTEATKRGVEVAESGRILGLVQVHHWCGNDPVREHIAKVDLADMVTYLRVGEPIGSIPEAEFLAREPGGAFSQSGWNVSEYLRFQSWERVKDLAR